MFGLLICDDHPPIRTVLRLLAKEAAGHCDVTETGNAADLMDALHGRGAYDLLVLDLQLPGGSAMALIPEVRRLRPSMSVIVFSADENPETIMLARNAGANDYLAKSVSEQVLFNTLRQAVLAAGRSNPAAQDATQQLLPQAAAGAAQHPATLRLGLSPRQAEVLGCLMRGMSAKEIARALDISTGTVKSHTVAVFRALNVSSRARAVIEAHHRGIAVPG